MTLILPPRVKAAYRPFANAAAVDLMQELQARGILHELSGSILMTADPTTYAGDYSALRQSVLSDLLHQMSMAIGSSGRCLLFAERTPDPTVPSGVREILHARMLICTHPKDGQITFPTIPVAPGEPPQPEPMGSIPESQMSLPLDSARPLALESGVSGPNSPGGSSSTKKGRKLRGV